jgi:hypothetical protein
MDLESLAVLAGGCICVFYGVYGLSLVATSDCTGTSETLGGNEAPLTVVRSTFYCILALLAGAGLFAAYAYMQTGGSDDGGAMHQLATYGAIFNAHSGEAGEWRSYTYRYFFASFGLFALVAYLMEWQLIGPLKRCQGAPRASAPLAWDVRNTLERVSGLVWLAMALFVAGFAMSFWQHSLFEKKAEELETGGAEHGRAPGPGFVARLFGAGKQNKPSMEELRSRAAQQARGRPDAQRGPSRPEGGGGGGGGGGGNGWDGGGGAWKPPDYQGPAAAAWGQQQQQQQQQWAPSQNHFLPGPLLGP